MDAQTSNEFSIAYLKRSIAAQEERIIAGLMKGVDTVEMEDRVQGDLAVLRRIQRESSSNRQADGLACNILSNGDRQINGLYLPATSSVSSREAWNRIVASAAGGWLVTSITGFPSDVAARCCTPSVRHEASHGRGLQQSPRHTTENPFAHAAVAISTANNEIGALFAGDVMDFISGFV